MFAVFVLLLSFSPLNAQQILDGVYKYDITWENVKAAEVTLVIFNDSGYRMHISGSTSSWLKPFYTLNYEANAWIENNLLNVLAKAFKVDSREEEEIFYRKKGGNLLVERLILRKKTKNSKDQRRQEQRTLQDVWDPFSAALAAVGEKWDKGKQVTYSVSNGKTSYVIKLVCTDKIEEEDKTTFYVKPFIESSNKRQMKKFKGATMKLASRNGSFIVEEIKSRVFIGNVYFRLKDFQPNVPIWYRNQIDEAMAHNRNFG